MSADLSAWRNFPKPKPLTARKGKPRKYPTPALFYGYPAEVISKWCCVSLSTARAYKCGVKKPGKAVQGSRCGCTLSGAC